MFYITINVLPDVGSGHVIVDALHYKVEGAGSIPEGFIGVFYWHNSGVDSASNRNEYQ